MRYFYYILFVVFMVACSYKIGSIERENSDPMYSIKSLYYMGVEGLVLEVSSNDLFQSVTIKNNYEKKFYLTRKKFSKNLCFEDNQNLELCLENNMAILTEDQNKKIKLILMSVEK